MLLSGLVTVELAVAENVTYAHAYRMNRTHKKLHDNAIAP